MANLLPNFDERELKLEGNAGVEVAVLGEDSTVAHDVILEGTGSFFSRISNWFERREGAETEGKLRKTVQYVRATHKISTILSCKENGGESPRGFLLERMLRCQEINVWALLSTCQSVTHVVGKLALEEMRFNETTQAILKMKNTIWLSLIYLSRSSPSFQTSKILSH